MTGTLDRIETKIAGETRFPTVVLTKDEAEALVEVAKAAQDEERRLRQIGQTAEGLPGKTIACSSAALISWADALAAALARLEDNQ